ncbi:MAG: hypothetical protein K2G37_00940 [Clostridia bacterium]|nr:hypothetical protein [Clostridia bacterium]MDE7328517.1 hypothetical protein [Clostridia bacterium]
MKKKSIAIVAVILIVALTCSLAACSKTMFDGSFKKEATQEQAQSAWDGASAALSGGDTASLSLASSLSNNVAIKDWEGAKISSTSKITFGGSDGVDSFEKLIYSECEGSFLFDNSAMAITSSISSKNVNNGVAKTKTLDAGMFVKGDVFYENITFANNSYKIKADGTDAVSTLTSPFIDSAINDVKAIVCESSYEEFIQEFDDIKAYIDDSGDYNRVKYVFSSKAVVSFYDDFLSWANELDLNLRMGECSLIIVMDKATNAFQGAKLAISIDCSYKDDEVETSFSVDVVTSIENYGVVSEEAFPADLDSYTAPTQSEMSAILDDMYEVLYSIYDFS